MFPSYSGRPSTQMFFTVFTFIGGSLINPAILHHVCLLWEFVKQGTDRRKSQRKSEPRRRRATTPNTINIREGTEAASPATEKPPNLRSRLKPGTDRRKSRRNGRPPPPTRRPRRHQHAQHRRAAPANHKTPPEPAPVRSRL